MSKHSIIVTPRGRSAQMKIESKTHYFRFKYAHKGQENVCEFSRKYPLCGRLIDAVIDNHQIKQHHGIILPERTMTKGRVS